MIRQPLPWAVHAYKGLLWNVQKLLPMVRFMHKREFRSTAICHLDYQDQRTSKDTKRVNLYNIKPHTDVSKLQGFAHQTSGGGAVAARSDKVVQAVDASERGDALRHFQRRVYHSVRAFHDGILHAREPFKNKRGASFRSSEKRIPSPARRCETCARYGNGGNMFSKDRGGSLKRRRKGTLAELASGNGQSVIREGYPKLSGIIRFRHVPHCSTSSIDMPQNLPRELTAAYLQVIVSESVGHLFWFGEVYVDAGHRTFSRQASMI